MEKENLMLEFPYRPGDKLPNGTKISVVCMGDANDTFGGYRCKEVIRKVDDIPEYGKEIVCPSLDEARTTAKHQYPLEVMGPVPFGYKKDNPQALGKDGYPKGAKVWFRVEGEKQDRFCTPLEFLEIAADAEKAGGAEVVDTLEEETERQKAIDTAGEGGEGEPDEAICQATTKKGNPCQRSAITGGIYCSSHNKT